MCTFRCLDLFFALFCFLSTCLFSSPCSPLSSTSPRRATQRRLPALVRNPDHAASRPSARIARLQAVLVAALAQVVGARMHDDRAPQHGLLADQLDEAVLERALPVAVGVGLEVAEVADVAGLVGGCAVISLQLE